MMEKSERREVARDVATATGERCLPSDELFGPAPVVVILHRNERYRLRQTRLGKLILTK